MSDLERLLPLECLGESHCLRFANRLARSAVLPHPVLARAHFLQHIDAATFTGDGGLHGDLAAALVAAGLCVGSPQEDGSERLDTAHQARTFAGRVLAARHAALVDEPLVAPAMLLFAGDKDLHSLAMQIGPRTDFELPEDPGHGMQEGAMRVPYHAVEAGLQRRLQPFFTGLELLRDAGFARMIVHCLVPRVRDDERVARWLHGVRVPATVRTKLAIVSNRLLLAECRRLRIGFVDVWAELAKDGFLDPRFDLDGIHCNHLATAASLAVAAQEIAALAAHATNPAQYELLRELAVARPIARSGLDRTFVEAGHVVVALRDTVMPVPGRIAAAPAESHRAHPDWCGLAEASVPSTPLARLGDDELGTLHDVLFGAEARAALEAGSDNEVGICLVRALRPVEPSGIGATQSLTAPAVARRAVLVLHGGLGITCRPRGEAAAGQSRRLVAGELLAFAADRVQLQCTDVLPGTEVLEIGLLPRLPGEPCRLLSTGWVDWPCDPFRLPLLGQRACPATDGDVLRRWREIEGRTIVTSSVVAAEGASPPAGSEQLRLEAVAVAGP